MKNCRFTTRQMVLDAMLAAMCTVLASIALQIGGNFKITFEGVPVHIGALLFGPIDGMLIGGIGTFIYQVLFSGYGITLTTALWILPYVVSGLLVGTYSKAKDYNLSRGQLIFIILTSELAITLLNTFALYVDSKLYGYYSAAFVFGTFTARLVLCAAKSIAYSVILPALLKPLKKTIGVAL